MPQKGVSTPQAYTNYDAMGEKTVVETDKLVQAMAGGNLADIAKYMANDLEKAAGSDETQPIKEKLLQLGATGSMMTGSGAAVYGIFEDEEAAQKAAETLKDKTVADQLHIRSVFVAKPVNFGASVKKR